MPLMKIDCCLIVVVKSICTDLDSLSFIRHFLVQIVTLLTAYCSFLVELSTISPIAMIAVSYGRFCKFYCDVRNIIVL
jgi:hypothetical protein